MRPRGSPRWRAKADGRWDAAYDSPANAVTVPDDLQAALDANPAALTMFGTLSSRNRFAILLRISDAQKPRPRARRIDKFVQMLADGQTIYPSGGESDFARAWLLRVDRPVLHRDRYGAVGRLVLREVARDPLARRQLEQRQLGLPADLLRLPAAGVEPARRWRVDRARRRR